jgi:hypothetical protein
LKKRNALGHFGTTHNKKGLWEYRRAWSIAGTKQDSPGLVPLRTMIAFDNFNATIDNVASVTDVFEPADNWAPELKEVKKNAYSAEFRLVGVPSDMALDEECGQPPVRRAGKPAERKYFATVFRVKQGSRRNKVTMLLWTQEYKYWKMVAIRNEDSKNADQSPEGRNRSSDDGSRARTGCR